MAKFKLQEACNRAKEALENGDGERAIAMCQHIVRYYPRCVEAYRLLGEAYLERGDTTTADKLFSYVVQADPQNVLAHIGRAIIREERGDIDSAIGEFERAYEIDPSIGELREELLRLYTARFGSEGAKIRTSRVGLAHLYARDYLFPQAVTEYNDILRSEPRLDVRVALALTLWRAGNDEAAADLCNAILQQVPNNLQANLILGQIWLAQGQRDDALALLRRALDLDPDNGLARSLYESRASRILLPPLTYYSAELPRWDGSELTASSELPVGLNEVVELEENALPSHLVEAATATAEAEPEVKPVEMSAEEVAAQLTEAEHEVDAEAERDAAPAWLLSEAPVVETAYPADGQAEAASDGQAAAPELQRQRLDRSEFLQRLATAGVGLPPGPASEESSAPVESSVATPEAAPAEADAGSEDWLEQLAASTRFDADAPQETGLDLNKPRERGFLDELLDEEEPPAPPAPTGEIPTAEATTEATPALSSAEVALPGSDETTPTVEDTIVLPASVEGVTTIPPMAEQPAADVAAATTTSEPAVAETVGLPPVVAATEASAAPVEQHRRTTGPLPDLGDTATTPVPAAAVAKPSTGPLPETAEASVAPALAPEATTSVEASAPSEPTVIAPAVSEDFAATPTASQPPDELAAPLASTPAAGEAALAEAAPLEGAIVAPAVADIASNAPAEVAMPEAEAALPHAEAAAVPQHHEAPPADTAPEHPEQYNPDSPLDILGYFMPDHVSDDHEANAAAPSTNQPSTPTEPVAVGTNSRPVAAPAPSDIPAAATSATTPEEETMSAPSYAEDDEQGRTFDFDWDKEGLPDYLKEFALGENSALTPPTEQPAAAANQAQSSDNEGLPSWLASTPPAAVPPTAPVADEGLPSWLTAAQPPATPAAANTPTMPTMPTAPSSAAAELDEGSLPSWLTPTSPASQPAASAIRPTPPVGQPSSPAASNVDAEGLPSWLSSTPSSPASGTPAAPASASTPPASSMSELDMEGLPSWLSTPTTPASSTPTSSTPPPANAAAAPAQSSELDMEGLPSWLSTTTPPAATPPPAPAASPMPPASATPDALGDAEGLPSWLTSAQPLADTTSPSSPPPAISASSPAPQSDMEAEGLPSWLSSAQPLADATPASPRATSTPAAPPNDNLDDLGLPSWLSPADSAAPSAAAPTPPPAMPSNLQPFSLTDFESPSANVGPRLDDQPSPPNQSDFANLQPFTMEEIGFTPPSSQSPIPAAPAAQSFSYTPPPGDELADLEDFVDFLKPSAPATSAASAAPQPPAAPEIPASLKPFSLEDFDASPGPAPQSGGFDAGANVQPFSLADMTAPASAPNAFDNAPRVQPFSLADTAPTPATPLVPSVPPPTAAGDHYNLPSDLQPFSFDDLDLGGSMTAPAPPTAAASSSDFGSLATPPSTAAANMGGDYALPEDLKPFSFDDFDALAGPLPSTPAASSAAPAVPPTTDLTDYQLPSQIKPFSLTDETASAQAGTGGNNFDFAPFSFDDLLQESPPPPPVTPATSFSMADLGLADTARARTSDSTPTLDHELEEPSDVDVRNFSWQQSNQREPTTPPVQPSAEDDGLSMFAKLRRRKEELERTEPAPEEPVSSVPPVGAPLTDEERAELEMMNWPAELQDMNEPALASPPAVTESSAPVIAEQAAPTDYATSVTPAAASSDYEIGAEAAAPAAAAGSEDFDLSGLDLSPEERAYLLGEDVPIPGLEAVRHLQEDTGTGDYLMEAESTPTEEQMEAEVARDFVPATAGEHLAQPQAAVSSAAEYAAPAASIPSEDELEAAIGRDFAMPTSETASRDEDELEAAIGRDFTMPTSATATSDEDELEAAMARDFLVPSAETSASYEDMTAPTFDDEMAAAAGESAIPPAYEAEVSSQEAEPFATDIYQAFEREGGLEASTTQAWPTSEAAPTTEEPSAASRERWVDFLASPPRPPIEIAPTPSAELPAESAELYETPVEELAATPVAEELDYIVIEETPAPQAAPATEQASTYVHPSTPTVPPSSYVAPGPPMYMDNRPATPAPTAPIAQAATPPSAPPAVEAPAVSPSAEQQLVDTIAPPPSRAATSVATEDTMPSIGAVRSYLDENRDDIAARLALASYYKDNEDYDNAFEQYRTIIKSKSVPAPALESVVNDLQELLTVEELNNNPRVHRLLGDAYMKQGLFQHAISQYNWLLTK